MDVIPLDDPSISGTKSRAQFYNLRQPTDSMADNGRFALMKPPGMDALQPCEFQFLHLEERIARLSDTSSGYTTSIHGINIALKTMIRSTAKHVFRSCSRSAGHFWEAFFASAQSANGRGNPLSLDMLNILSLKQERIAVHHSSLT